MPINTSGKKAVALHLANTYGDNAGFLTGKFVTPKIRGSKHARNALAKKVRMIQRVWWEGAMKWYNSKKGF